MAIDAGILVTMVGDKTLQLDGRFGQVLDRKGDILDQARRAHGACTAHAGEDTRTNRPILAIDGRVGSELDRNIGLEARQAVGDGVDAVLQVLGGDGFGLGEDGGEVVVITWLHTLDETGIHIPLVLQKDRVIDRCQRQVVEHLGTLDHQVLLTHGDVGIAGFQLLERHYSLAALTHREEIKHRTGLARVVVECAHRHPADKRQGALAAHHTVGDDVKRVIIGDERPQIQSRHVLDAVFLADAVSQRLVGPDAVAQGLNLGNKVRMGLLERLTARLVTRVEHSAVRKHQAGRQEHAVTIGMSAAIHARGIVGDYAAHHGRADTGGIGRKDTPKGFQDLVDPSAHNARLQGDAGSIFTNTIFLPVLACHNKDAVAHTLSRQ